MIFTTLDRAQVKLPPDFALSGERRWGYVVHTLHVPWFHFTLSVGGNSSVIFASDEEQWLKLIAKPPRGQKITGVRLVSPGWLNKTGEWQMEALQELWIGTEPDSDQRAKVYVVRSGSRYVDSDLRTAENELRDLERQYSAEQLEKTRR